MSRDTGVVVRELFMSATKSVLVAGFAVHRGREIFGSLAERMTERPDLDVRLFLNIQRAPGDTTIAAHFVRRFGEEFRRKHWPASRFPAVYYDPRSLAMHEKTRTSLQAKCVVIVVVRLLRRPTSPRGPRRMWGASWMRFSTRSSGPWFIEGASRVEEGGDLLTSNGLSDDG